MQKECRKSESGKHKITLTLELDPMRNTYSIYCYECENCGTHDSDPPHPPSGQYIGKIKNIGRK